jgi:GR25 family glycosyltransferase involved in LPS biosynthesis
MFTNKKILYVKDLKNSGVISRKKYDEMIKQIHRQSLEQQKQQQELIKKSQQSQQDKQPYKLNIQIHEETKPIQKHNKINTFFDKIYLLNLDTRPDRLKTMKQRFKENGISNFTRFSAINGKDEQYNQHFNSLKGFFDSRGAYGVLLSIYKILMNAIQNGYKKILIFEDDAVFHKNFTEIFNHQMNKLPEYWKLLYLGSSMHTWRINSRCACKDGFLIPSGSIPGAFALGISSDCYPHLLKQIMTFSSAWDLAPLKAINTIYKNQCFVIYPNVVVADPRDSNIRNGKTLEKKAYDCGWKIPDYDF